MCTRRERLHAAAITQMSAAGMFPLLLEPGRESSLSTPHPVTIQPKLGQVLRGKIGSEK